MAFRRDTHDTHDDVPPCQWHRTPARLLPRDGLDDTSRWLGPIGLGGGGGPHQHVDATSRPWLPRVPRGISALRLGDAAVAGAVRRSCRPAACVSATGLWRRPGPERADTPGRSSSTALGGGIGRRDVGGSRACYDAGLCDLRNGRRLWPRALL